jgi:hypothetical protein
MKIKRIFPDFTEFRKSGFNISPEAFNTINMGFSTESVTFVVDNISGVI